MTKTIDTLVEDILNLFNGHSVSTNVHEFSSAVGEIFVKRLGDYLNDNTKEKSLRLSQIGRPLRQLYYELKGAPAEELSAQVKLKFSYGDVLEQLLIFLAMESGHTVSDLQKEVEIGGIPGHIDAIIDDCLVDVKSCSSYSFKKFKDGSLRDNDPFGYIYQLSSYWACLPNINRAGFLAIDKQNGNLCFMELKDNERKSEADVRSRIETIREVVSRNDVPERCYEPEPEGKSGNLRLGVECSYCRHKHYCWRDSNDGAGLRTYFYATGPKYFVKIIKEPKVQESITDQFPTKEK